MASTNTAPTTTTTVPTATTTNTSTAAGTDSATSAGASIGQKVKGAFQAAHGIGESIRGNTMDFVDSALGTRRSNHDATVRGQQEAEIGVENMHAGRAGTAGTPVGTAPMQTSATTTGTSTAAPPQPLGNDVKEPVASVGHRNTGTALNVQY